MKSPQEPYIRCTNCTQSCPINGPCAKAAILGLTRDPASSPNGPPRYAYRAVNKTITMSIGGQQYECDAAACCGRYPVSRPGAVCSAGYGCKKPHLRLHYQHFAWWVTGPSGSTFPWPTALLAVRDYWAFVHR